MNTNLGSLILKVYRSQMLHFSVKLQSLFMIKLLTTVTELMPEACLYAVLYAVLMIMIIFVPIYFYLSRRRYVFTRTLATSKHCSDILVTLTKTSQGAIPFPGPILRSFRWQRLLTALLLFPSNMMLLRFLHMIITTISSMQQ